MTTIKRIAVLFTTAVITLSSLTGCGSADKASVKETAENFLSVVADDSKGDITQYASSDVANGDFVKLFNADQLVEQFAQGFSSTELTDETHTKLDEFFSLYSGMIKKYEVTNVEVQKGGTATAIATLNTAFPIDIINSERASSEITLAVSTYNNTNAEEIAALYEEGQEVAESKIYNDIILIILDIYEKEIANSEEMTYAIALDLEKNPETDTWIVTGVKDYDSSNSEDSAN